MTTQRADARKRQEAMWGEPRWSPGDGDDPVVEDVRLSAAEVWHGAERVDAEALLDQLESRGLRVVRRS